MAGIIVCIVMKRTCVFLLLCAALAAAQPPCQRLYLLPMGHGLDQFLANHLAASGAFRVVTDPKLADVVMSERIGPAFELRMKEIFPPAEPAPAPAVKEENKEASQGSDLVQAFGNAPPAGIVTSFGRGKGNVFLVDAKSRHVLWSTFEKPASSDAEDLDHAASRIVARLSKTIAVNHQQASKHAPADTAQPPSAPAK